METRFTALIRDRLCSNQPARPGRPKGALRVVRGASPELPVQSRSPVYPIFRRANLWQPCPFAHFARQCWPHSHCPDGSHMPTLKVSHMTPVAGRNKVRTDDGISITYQVTGDGPRTVLALHGWGGAGSGHSWRDVIRHLDLANP